MATALVKAVARFSIIVALMVSIGAHWGVLQVAAWATMVKDYSAENGFWEGLKSTFDGEHLCSMCKKIHEGKETEQKQQQTPVSKSDPNHTAKWLSFEASNLISLPSWNEGQTVQQHDTSISHFSEWNVAPSVPPPRLAV